MIYGRGNQHAHIKPVRRFRETSGAWSRGPPALQTRARSSPRAVCDARARRGPAAFRALMRRLVSLRVQTAPSGTRVMIPRRSGSSERCGDSAHVAQPGLTDARFPVLDAEVLCPPCKTPAGLSGGKSGESHTRIQRASLSRGGAGQTLMGCRVLPILLLSVRGCDRQGRPHEGGDEGPFPTQAQPISRVGGKLPSICRKPLFLLLSTQCVDTVLSIIYSLLFNIQGNKKTL